jgi:hypothetical protein
MKPLIKSRVSQSLVHVPFIRLSLSYFVLVLFRFGLSCDQPAWCAVHLLPTASLAGHLHLSATASAQLL